MKAKLILMRVLFALAGIMLTMAPATALAHDNIGGDELAAANWMLIGAFVVALTGILGGIWAWRAGQFTNVEESKYTMLDTADDYDAIMAEVDARDNRLRASEIESAQRQQAGGSVGRAGV